MRRSLLSGAEVALGLVTLTSILGLVRVFSGSDWVAPLVLHAVVAHTVAAALRRRGVGIVASVAVGTALMVWLIVAVHAGETMRYLVPTTDSITTLRDHVDGAFSVFQEVKAPTEALPGYQITLAAAVWVVAMLTDLSAFRLDAPFESVLPSSTLFVLGAILGSGQHRVWTTGLWLTAVLTFVLVRRADRLSRHAVWVGERRNRGPGAVISLGAALTVVALVGSAVVGPRLPGAESEAVVPLRELGGDGPGTRVTISPLVDIRSRLVDQADVEVFTVRSTQRAYWRLTSLDRFDGRIWSSNGSFGAESGDLPDGLAVDADRVVFEQDIEISALSQIWIPAAYEPRAVAAAIDVRYDEESGTLIVDNDVPTSDGNLFRIRSALPVFDPAALASATTEIPGDIAERYLAVPDDFPQSVRDLAVSVTGAGASVYDRMVLLQNFFRDNFEYSLDVQSGHDDNVVEQFVMQTRTGYCEQFAGSFAAMARSLGVPARVAVGFTPGEVSPTDPTTFTVRGEHAHAWPEVYLGGYGWVAFEPTPGRGAPLAEQYTGVPEQQAATANPQTATTVPSTATSTPTSGGATTTPTSIVDPGALDPTTPTLPTPDESPSPWPGRLTWFAATLIGVGAAYLLVVPVWFGARRWRRRRAATSVDRQVAVAWDECLTAVQVAGATLHRGDTHREVVAAVDRAVPGAGEPMATLAATVEAVTFSPHAPDPSAGTTALTLSDSVRDACAATRPASERLLDRYHPSRVRRRERLERDRIPSPDLDVDGDDDVQDSSSRRKR